MKSRLNINERYAKYVIFAEEVENPTGENSYSYKFLFPNGYAASVIKKLGSVGYEHDLFEVAILKDHQVVDEVKGCLNNDDVMNFLEYVMGIETIEIQKNTEEFISLLKSTERKGIDSLINWLKNSTDFFTCPASTKYHLARKGGLLQHSLNVYNQLIKEIAIDCSEDEIPEEMFSEIIIVSLLHDICKANFYTVKEKNVKNKDGAWVKEPYYSIDDKFPLGHGEKSVILIQKFIDLTDDEIMAIRWHMGGFESKDNYQYLSGAFSKCQLALSLHIADLKATYIDENE